MLPREREGDTGVGDGGGGVNGRAGMMRRVVGWEKFGRVRNETDSMDEVVNNSQL